MKKLRFPAMSTGMGATLAGVYVDITTPEMVIIGVSIAGVIGAGVLGYLRAWLLWVWVVLICALPLIIGVFVRASYHAEIRLNEPFYRSMLDKDEFNQLLGRADRPMLWAAMGMVAIAGMAVVCYFSRPKPRVRKTTPTEATPLPPAAPGPASGDWPEIG